MVCVSLPASELAFGSVTVHEHVACVTMSTGSPFSFKVVDPDKVCASGDGLNLVRVCKMTKFFISAPCARLCDITVKITGAREFFLLRICSRIYFKVVYKSC